MPSTVGAPDSWAVVEQLQAFSVIDVVSTRGDLEVLCGSVQRDRTVEESLLGRVLRRDFTPLRPHDRYVLLMHRASLASRI
jgi:hypothetical protein